MSGFSGSFQMPGGVALRLVRSGDGDFLFRLFVDARPWLSWTDGGDDATRALYEQQYRAMQAGKDAVYPEHLDLVIERMGEAVGRVVVDLGYGNWRIAELQIAAVAQRGGIGTNVVRGLQMAAARTGVCLRLAAPMFGSHGRRLYEQLGFRLCATDGALAQMEWHPPDAAVAGRQEAGA